MHFNVKYASVLILLISEYLSNECNLMEMQIGLRTPHGRNIFDLNTCDEIHNYFVVSSLSPDLSYRLEDEYNITDEMQLGD